MTALSKYVQGKRGVFSELARQVGVSQGQISRVAAGKSRPSPELAKRIEEATDGDVRAAELLGLEEAGAAFDHAAAPRSISGGRWSMRVSTDGSLRLSKDMVGALGFAPGERLLFTPDGDHVRVHSTDRMLKAIQAEVRGKTPEGISLADELIAERKAEAARE